MARNDVLNDIKDVEGKDVEGKDETDGNRKKSFFDFLGIKRWAENRSRGPNVQAENDKAQDSQNETSQPNNAESVEERSRRQRAGRRNRNNGNRPNRNQANDPSQEGQNSNQNSSQQQRQGNGNKKTKRVIAGVAVAGGLVAIGLAAKAISNSANKGTDENGTYIVQYDGAIMLESIPKNNIKGMVYEGDVYQFNSDDISHYNKSGSQYIKVSEDNAKNNVVWMKLLEKKGKTKGYIPDDYADHYYKYDIIQDTAIRTEPSMQSGEEIQLLKPGFAGNAWFCLEIDNGVYDGVYDAEHSWSKVIIKKPFGEDEYIRGYVDASLLGQRSGQDGIAVINRSTNYREYASMPEIDADEMVGRAKNGTIVKVTGSYVSENGDVWYKCNVNGEKAYMPADALKELRDFDYELVSDSNGKGVYNKCESIKLTTLGLGSKIKVDTSNIIEGKYEVVVGNGESTCVGYMKAEDLGLPLTVDYDKTKLRTSNIDKFKFVMYITPDCDYNGLVNTIDTMTEKDTLGGIMIKIGESSDKSDNERFLIQGLSDDQVELNAENQNNTYLLRDAYNSIEQMFNNNEESVDFDMTCGNIKGVEKIITKADELKIPVGFFYNQRSTNTNRASAEAAYVHSVFRKLKLDMGVNYEKVAKLPYTEVLCPIDGNEDVQEDRINLLIGKMRLMSNGESVPVYQKGNPINPEALNYYWTIDNVNIGKGYNIFSDCNNYYTLSSSLDTTQSLDELRRTRIQNDLIDSDIQMVYESTQFMQKGRPVEFLDDMHNILKFVTDGINMTKQNQPFDEALWARTDLCKIFKEFHDRGNTYDFALTSNNTIAGISNGTYTHDVDYINILNNIVVEQFKENKGDVYTQPPAPDFTEDGEPIYHTYDEMQAALQEKAQRRLQEKQEEQDKEY